jgi:putative solute:sodium symporter small subunit
MSYVSQWTHWPRFKNLMLVMFGLWLTFFFVIHTFVRTLNKIVVPVLELPLGIYMPVQAAIVVFLVTLFWFARATRS